MTTYATLHSFFNSFGIPAFPITDVEQHPLPCITYDVALSHLDEGEVVGVVDIWYKTESEAIPNAKAEELSQAIGRGSRVLPTDEGYIIIRRGSPFCQPLNDDTDTSIKRRHILLTIEYNT